MITRLLSIHTDVDTPTCFEHQSKDARHKDVISETGIGPLVQVSSLERLKEQETGYRPSGV